MNKCTHLNTNPHVFYVSNCNNKYKGLKCVKHALTKHKEGLSYVFFKALIIALDL